MAKKKKDAHEELTASLMGTMGDDAQMLDSENALCHVDFSVSSRSIVVDSVLAGGRAMPCSMIPFGRQVEISGLNGSGKTTLCAQIAAETQRMGGVVIVIDTEERMDVPYWNRLGCDTSKIIKIKAKTIEEVFNRLHKFMMALSEHNAKTKTDRPMLVIWDSVGGTSSGDVVEGKDDFMTNAKKMMGREAKLIGIGVTGLNPLIAANNICLLYTNHVYKQMGVSFGDPWTEPKGEKLRFQATVRIRLTAIGEISEEDSNGNKVVIGQHVRVKANKNSMAEHRMTKDAIVIGGIGFSNDYTVFHLGKKRKIITTAGGWSSVTIDGELIKFQGWKGFQLKVATHPKYSELLESIKEIL